MTKGEDTRTFFTLPEYEAWKEVRGAAPSDGGSGSDPEPLNCPNMFFFISANDSCFQGENDDHLRMSDSLFSDKPIYIYTCMFIYLYMYIYITYMSIRFSWSHDHGRNDLCFPMESDPASFFVSSGDCMAMDSLRCGYP